MIFSEIFTTFPFQEIKNRMHLKFSRNVSDISLAEMKQFAVRKLEGIKLSAPIQTVCIISHDFVARKTIRMSHYSINLEYDIFISICQDRFVCIEMHYHHFRLIPLVQEINDFYIRKGSCIVEIILSSVFVEKRQLFS